MIRSCNCRRKIIPIITITQDITRFIHLYAHSFTYLLTYLLTYKHSTPSHEYGNSILLLFLPLSSILWRAMTK